MNEPFDPAFNAAVMTDQKIRQINRQLRRLGYRELLPAEFERAAWYCAAWQPEAVARLIASDRTPSSEGRTPVALPR